MSEPKVVPANTRLMVTDEYGDILPVTGTSFFEDTRELYVHVTTKGSRRDRKRKKHYEKLQRVQKANRDLAWRTEKAVSQGKTDRDYIHYLKKTRNDLRFENEGLWKAYKVLRGEDVVRSAGAGFEAFQAQGARELLAAAQKELPDGELRALITSFLVTGV